jgi:large subunit ribosomal protein L31
VDEMKYCYTTGLDRLRRKASISIGEELIVKENIHPKYVVTKVTCGCGNAFLTRSTLSELKVDICNACHPFYTGKLKYVDTAGRIEKFQKKFAATGYRSLAPSKKKAEEPASEEA